MDFPNTSGIRSPFSPRVRQSITGRRPGLGSAKKNQSKFMQSAEAPTGEVIYKTPLTTVETYGHPLPVLVTEALTFASGEVTVGLSANGYCWLVFGRRLLVWARDGGAARELTLPQTDLQHKAELVEVFYEDGAQMPSCIGVSPEGVVRYWPSVGQELYVDTSCELAGQECSRLVASESASGTLLLATTSCSLLQLKPEPERPGVTCRQLRPPSGWLGGIGRRVSLLFFGSMPANADTKLVGVVILQDGPMSASEEPGYIALVGGGGGAVLQLWRGPDLHEHNLRRALTDASRAQGDASSLQVTCLDVRASSPRALALLVACANVARSDTRHAIAYMSVEDPANPRVTSLIPLRGCTLSPDTSPRLLPLPNAAALYTSTYVARVSTVANDKVEYIDVASEGDRILGATICNGQPLLFSRKHGVLALTSAETVSANVSVCESPMGSPCPSDMYDGNLSLYEIDPHEVSMVTTDACGKLKTAFLFHLRRDTSACRDIVQDLFPHKQRSDPALDNTVVRIATELCDDIPQGDPRWKQRPGGPATNIPLGSSSALQINAQLRDKQRAFSLFADFLRATGLWQRLGSVSLETEGECVSTVSALGMLAEKLATALALRKKQQTGDSQLIDAAVYQVVCGDEAEPEEPEVEAALSSGALSPADVCFRRVSSIQRVLVALCSVCAPAQHDARALASHAQHVSRLLTSILTEVHGARAHWPPARALRAGSLLPKLVQLHTRAVAQYGPGCPDVVLRSSLYEATSLLADLILTEAEPLRQHSNTRHVADKMRRDIIQPYIDAGQTERAAVLAEKFKDFELLVHMCARRDDMERLYSYIDKYSAEGIAEIAFAYLMEHGGATTARLVRALGARYPARLHAWLARTSARDPVRALHHLSAKDYGQAAQVLSGLAQNEKESVKRMTMYIESESDTLTEYDYKKALDLTDFVQDMERRDDLRLRVWCACIRRSSWDTVNVEAPAAELQDKMFFRLMHLVHFMGGDLELLLPPAEDILTARELAELVSDARFRYIIKYGYECFHTPDQHDMLAE
ncbi:nuclear pore complex protein Nup133 [Leguminivora glycinivorella]|uniref:nuclear pore complex protein Nup133 n=1 Tax=Leguminivora glycinivorella TaxID=1035111 RepID=UPI00200BEAA0|nr:nuclear pore complex protein Nup133 [Leguminivora glycinivorella]